MSRKNKLSEPFEIQSGVRCPIIFPLVIGYVLDVSINGCGLILNMRMTFVFYQRSLVIYISYGWSENIGKTKIMSLSSGGVRSVINY